MPELWLVCEGVPDGVDASVVTSIFTRVLAAGVVVEPAHGSQAVAAVADFLESRRGGRAAYVIDRDYELREKADKSFQDGKRGFIWRRHSIENYLLHPAVILEALRRLQERARGQFGKGSPAWVAAIPTDPSQVVDGLRASARRRATEEAVRLAVHRLWEDLSTTAGRVQKRIPEISPGLSRQDHDAWREGLRQETQRLQEAARQAATSPHLEPESILRRFDQVYATVTAEGYVTDLEFLIDYCGRELLEEVRAWLEQLGVRLRYDRLLDELVSAVADVYAANRTMFGRDDFLDLANGVRAYGGLPPLG